MKNILYTLLCVLSLFIPTSFAQQNLQDVEWTSSSTSLPELEEGNDGYYVHGELAGRSNYFITGEKTQEVAKDYYIKFGKLTNSSSSSAKIFLGETGITSPSYYGDITVEFTDKVTATNFYAGSYLYQISGADVNTSFGNVKTTITGDATFSGVVYGGSYIYQTITTASYNSIALNIKNGTYKSSIYGTGYVRGNTWEEYSYIIVSEGVSLSIENATLTSTDGRIVAGTNTQKMGEVEISGGTNLYLGTGTTVESISTIAGGSYISTGGLFTITGGTSVVIDGANIGTKKQVNIYGGSELNENQLVGGDTIDTTKVSILSGNVNANVYGGSGIKDKWGKTVITGDTIVDIKGGEITGSIYGGSVSHQNYGPKDNYIFLNIEGTSNVKISGGTITGDVFGGSSINAVKYAGNTRDSVIIGGTNVDITGGTINGTVYGGSKLSAKGATNDSNTKDGAVNINISAGTITGGIVAGSYAIEGTSVGENFGATVSSAKVVVSGGSIGGDILASGKGNASIIENNSEVVFIGNSENIDFKGKVIGDTAENPQVLGKTILSFGEGEKTFTGTFSGSIENIDRVSVAANSDVTFTNSFNVAELIVQESSNVNLATDTNFEVLTISFNQELSDVSTIAYDMSEIFGDSTSIVLSNLEKPNSFNVKDSNGDLFEATYANQTITIIPEPSTYAAIFGALALGFVIYRRRK